MTAFPFGKLTNLFKRMISKSDKISINIAEETENEISNLFMTMYRILTQRLRQMALHEFEVDNSKLIIRSLVPQDLDLEKPLWKFKLHHGTTKMIDFNLPESTMLGIWGIHIPKNCPITQLTIMRSGSVIRILHIQHLNGDYFFDDPFTFSQNVNILFEVHNPTRKKTTSLGFYGIVVERRGLRVNP